VVNVGSALYLGYGPLEFNNGTTLKKNAAIQSGESATLSIAVPETHAPRLERALWLMDRYGTLGGAAATAGVPSPCSLNHRERAGMRETQVCVNCRCAIGRNA